MNSTGDRSGKRGLLARAGEAVLKVLSLFVILEPIWMLLPFAGFLYGSVLQIETLARHPATAWLTHFVFPVLTLGWTGPVLIAAGFGIFMVGAGQIYWARIRRSGLVTGGLYRFVRHPQYVALTLFGLGMLLTWGRAVTFLAFFVMMFLYYYLARSEERSCVRLFGSNYERYRERTSFIIPGDRLLRPLGARLPRLRMPAPLRVAAAFVASLGACLALMWLIDAVKVRTRTVPFLVAKLQFDLPKRGPDSAPAQRVAITAGEVNRVPFVQAGRLLVVRGPYRNAWQPGFAERVLLRLRQSQQLKDFLAFLEEEPHDAAIVFCAPFDKPDQPGTPGMRAGEGDTERRGPPPDPAGPDRVRLVIMRCRLAKGAGPADALADKSKRKITGGCIAPVDLGHEEGQDIVEGQVIRPGSGFPGEQRWDSLQGQLAAMSQLATNRPTGAALPGSAEGATLVLVLAPILRTRIDVEFAQEILDRLMESGRLRRRLCDSGAGGDVVAVGFPTPGPNWYREHHGRPQISVCVMLVRQGDQADLDRLFHSDTRGPLLGAFFADMNLKIDRGKDCVGEVRPIGPWRDLEERWRFFLSGIGGGAHH